MKGRIIKLLAAKLQNRPGTNQFFYGSGSKNKPKLEKSIYAPHPFTNWSLNPHYRSAGRRQHTVEGFRKSSEHDILQKQFENKGAPARRLFCVGGSSTYCTELADYQMSWPCKLQQKLNRESSQNVVVANGGVGGWGTLQSLIRFSAWGPILRPDLTIVYQSKNDLTPFFNGRAEEREILPLYENVMLQFSTRTLRSSIVTKLVPASLSSVYSDQISANEKGFERFSDDFAELGYTRYGMIADLANTWGGGVLFIPEIIDKSSPYFEPMQVLHAKMQDVVHEREWCEYFDILDTFPAQKRFFLDKMHFSEEGCDAFSDLLLNPVSKYVGA